MGAIDGDSCRIKLFRVRSAVKLWLSVVLAESRVCLGGGVIELSEANHRMCLA